MKFDLARFKKIKASKYSTTLRHPDGHEITIAHTALAPKMQQQLHALPFEAGGSVPEAPAKNAAAVQKGFEQSGGMHIDKWVDNVKSAFSSDPKPKPSPKAYAQGGGVQKFADKGLVEDNLSDVTGEGGSSQVPTQAPDSVDKIVDDTGGPAPEKKLSPVQEAYNKEATLQEPSTMGGKLLGLMIDNKALANDPEYMKNVTFGEQGAPALGIEQTTADSAQKRLASEQQASSKEAQDAHDAAVAKNKQLAAFGQPQIPVPGLPAGSASGTGAPKPPVEGSSTSAMQDLYGANATSAQFDKGAREFREGNTELGEATEDLGQANAEQYRQGGQRLLDLNAHYATQLNDLDTDTKQVQHDLANFHIDPNHFFASQDTGQRVATVVGLIAGGFAQGMGAGPNPAMAFLNQQIDRDIAAQKAELGKKENLLSANLRRYGNLKDAIEVTRVNLKDYTSSKLGEAAANASGDLEKARLKQQQGIWDADKAQQLGQIAMRKTLAAGVNSGQIPPEHLIRMAVPEKEQGEYYKQLKDAQNDTAIRYNTLDSFDQVLKTNNLLDRITSPIQTYKQVAALRGAALDKLTKDVSGRVTPETVKLIGGLFDTAYSNGTTPQALRRALDKLLSQNMHYPMIEGIGIDPKKFRPSGTSSGGTGAPISFVKK